MIRTEDQTLNLQLDALQQAGCNELFQDTASGSTIERKGLDEALAVSRPGATLVVWRDLQPHLARCVVPTAQVPALRSAAAASLARLWRGQGKHGEAHWMLEEIRRWFPEGIGTPDLTEARALLAES